MKKFRTADLKNIAYVSWPAVSPDGRVSAYVKYHADESTGEFPSVICVVDNETGMENCITTDGCSEKQPVFSMDGVHLYYLSDRSGEWQVWEKRIDGSDAVQVTTLRHGVCRFDVNEASGRIAFEATLWPEELKCGTAFVEMTAAEKEAWKEVLDWTPYVATDLVYKLDEWHGMRKGEFQHVGYMELNKENAVIVDAGFEAMYPALSGAGDKIAFQGYPYSGARGRMGESFFYDIESEEVVLLRGNMGLYPDHAPVWACHDRCVITAGFPEFEDHSNVMLPYLIDIKTHEYRLLLEKDITEPCSGVRPIRVEEASSVTMRII